VNTTRRQFLTTSSVLVAAAFGKVPLFGQQPQQPAPAQQPAPPPTFTPLRRNVGIFTGAGGTIGWLVSPAGVVVVDAGMPPNASVCLDGINERSAKRPIDVLFNTHHHGDHTGGNGIFRPTAKKIVAHVKVPELQKATARPGTEANQVYADTTFTDRWQAKIGDEAIHAVYFGPAHTGGDSVVFFEQANVVHMGDLVFNRRQPVTDRPGGCLLAGWVRSLERIAAGHDADTLYIFGHAKTGFEVTGRRADLLYQRDFLSAVLDHVRAQITAGRAREEIVKASLELKGFADHGPVVERVLTAAYEELTGL
jgi:glyoxylase-like metal-dependent hydrolase (beta-lactamase superfamily II)